MQQKLSIFVNQPSRMNVTLANKGLHAGVKLSKRNRKPSIHYSKGSLNNLYYVKNNVTKWAIQFISEYPQILVFTSSLSVTT
jgi:hypothetical protein